MPSSYRFSRVSLPFSNPIISTSMVRVRGGGVSHQRRCRGGRCGIWQRRWRPIKKTAWYLFPIQGNCRLRQLCIPTKGVCIVHWFVIFLFRRLLIPKTGVYRFRPLHNLNDIHRDFVTMVKENDGNIKYWIPRCQQILKPGEGMIFNTVDAAEQFYKEYANHVGFDVRRSTSLKFNKTNVIKEQYYVCSREGFNPPKNCESARKTTSNRVECCARFVIKSPQIGEGYKCNIFEERHNHEMIPLRRTA